MKRARIEYLEELYRVVYTAVQVDGVVNDSALDKRHDLPVLPRVGSALAQMREAGVYPVSVGEFSGNTVAAQCARVQRFAEERRGNMARLARLSGVRSDTLRCIVAGKTTNPRAATLAALVRALDAMEGGTENPRAAMFEALARGLSLTKGEG